MNFRIFVEKKKEFKVEARELFEDLKENLFIITSKKGIEFHNAENNGEKLK